ncbi:MAG: purine-nucleoside phosphorylase [Defluviitaleaceae bacterium]|nr:purine-nucleoside phosphorylase [Defluviitaleaceae bacterium]
MIEIENLINSTILHISKKVKNKPKIGVILGSGLGDFADNILEKTIIPFAEIPNFPISTVVGHKGEFVFGKYENIDLVLVKGRLHYYEGYTMEQITLPIRIMKKLDIESIIITNAAGGINENFKVSDFMIITDHINFSGNNPLIGKNLDEFGSRFPDCSNIYTDSLIKSLENSLLLKNIQIQKGIYLMCSGPSYETPAEIRMFRKWGADAVGMSTVPEAIVASHSGLKVLGISCITNMAAGISSQKLSHTEVLEISEKVKPNFENILKVAINICGKN